ncbi:MAG: DUF4358 domain-containing protein [Clostridia bacterium]|nr:DUF4358 domain-containing protein [Clostridia bacterium]
MKSKETLSLLVISILMFIGTGCSVEKNDNENFLNDAHLAVQEAYGDYYLPSVPMTGEELVERFGLDLEDVETFIAEAPMMSIHLDVFVGIKAKPDKVDEISKVLEGYRQMMISDLDQLPSNQKKLSSSEIYITGDYVFLLILGETDEMVASGAIKAINN